MNPMTRTDSETKIQNDDNTWIAIGMQIVEKSHGFVTVRQKTPNKDLSWITYRQHNRPLSEII